jgi:hypothetical protein
MPQSKLVLQFILDLTYRFEMIVMRIDFLSYKESCQYLSVLHLVHINIAHFIRIDRNMKGNNKLQGIQSIVHKFPCSYGKSVNFHVPMVNLLISMFLW